MRTFPHVPSLAAAELSAVLKAWEGLGYYARARNLHRAAAQIVSEFDGRLPTRCLDLQRIPGIGEYTAAALASIAYGEPVPVLDGNAQRVFARWTALREPTASKSGREKLRRFAREMLDSSDPGTWNQAVMELGAVICLPRQPACLDCPVQPFCAAYTHQIANEIPARTKKKPIPHYQVTAAVIRRNGEVLISKRFERGLLGGLWEFPGGKQEKDETLENCLRRELLEELGITVTVGEKICIIQHAYSHFRITLHVFNCQHVAGKPQALGCAEWRWIDVRDLNQYAFPKADQCIIEQLLRDN
ncbi:MAG: 8-oxo-dGTP diphosphatase MutT [bacterium]